MKRIATIATLAVILLWINPSRAQTVTETLSPSGPTVVVVLTSSNGGDPILTTIATLSASSNTLSKKSNNTIAGSTTPSRTGSSAPSTSSTDSSNDDDSDPSTHHIPSPVAMIAGSLAGFIAIVAAILVVCVTRRRRNGKRRRRRASIIRALEAQHAQSGENLDRDGYAISDSGSFSEEHSSSRRPGSTRNSTRESTRSGKKKTSTRGSGKHTTHVHVSPSDDVELDWRDADAGRQRPHGHTERPRLPTTSSPTSSHTVATATSTVATAAIPPNPALDRKSKVILGDASTHVDAPQLNSLSQDQRRLQSTTAHASASHVLGVSSPHPAIRPSHSLPTVDLPPAYEDVR